LEEAKFSVMERSKEDEPIFNPSDTIRYTAERRGVSVDALRIPERLLLTYQRSAFECAKSLIKGRSVEWIYGEVQPFCIGQFNGVEIGVGRFWIGAPAAASTLEEAIACGAKIIIEVGLAGGLQEYLKPADIIVVTEAIRDEGTSYHYLPPEVNVESSQRLRETLIKCLNEGGIRHFVGPVWSTDGVYRETLGKFRRFRDSGVLAVNMETSAIFAVAKYRGVEAASAQVISDILTEKGWFQAFHEKSVRESVEILLKAVLETLSRS
jgi:uridine phosphorylase